jgi:hypothetical protein
LSSELFGPVAVMYGVSDVDEAAASSVPYGIDEFVNRKLIHIPGSSPSTSAGPQGK